MTSHHEAVEWRENFKIPLRIPAETMSLELSHILRAKRKKGSLTQPKSENEVIGRAAARVARPESIGSVPNLALKINQTRFGQSGACR